MNSTDIDGIQVLTFILDEDCFGAEISAIQEVIEYRKVTAVPRTPEFMLGVINLRGQVIPVVDLRRYFSLNIKPTSVDSCIIIIEIEIDGERSPIGLLADRVKEVVELSLDDVKPAPKLGNRIDYRFIYGVAEYEDTMVILLRMARIFSNEELQDVVSSIDASSAKSGSQDQQKDAAH